MNQPAREMPRYKCHKVVHALKIADVTGETITPADPGYAAFTVDPKLFLRFTPSAGDYYVVYEDGYASFSPAQAFEQGYSLLDQPARPANGIRITPDHVKDIVAGAYITTADKAFAGCPVMPGMEQLTICVLMLKNGTKVVGLNHGAIDPAQHSAARGEADAYEDAINKVYELEGYLARQRLLDLARDPV